MSLRVGFLIDRWVPTRGGAEAALARFASFLEERGHEVLALALEAEAGSPGRHVPVRTSVNLPLLQRGRHERELAQVLVDTAEAERCDVTVGLRHLPRVDLFWPHGGSHLRSLEARARSKRHEAPVRARGHHKVFLELEHQLLQEGGARRVVCVSELVRRELTELYPACESSAVVVPNGVDLARFTAGSGGGPAPGGQALRAELDVPRDAQLVVFAARNPMLKGFGLLLEAIRALGGKERGQYVLLIAGARHTARWQRLARMVLPPERVRVREEVHAPDLFAAADMLVHPTWRDPCPLVVTEALASGTPVLTTEAAGNSELVQASGAGAVIPAGDVEALATALTDTLRELAAARPDPARIAASVQHLGEADWLERMEEELLGVARC